MEPKRIPLFPLEVVLFPGTLLPLHIFEPRYKLMIRHCREKQISFGVVLVKGEGVAPAGCTAEIMEVAKEYEDGKLDILTMGRLPFSILEVFQDNEYAEADVEYLEDEPFVEKPPAASLLKLYEQCHELAFGSKPDAPDADRYDSFSYQIASELPLDLAYKQTLLEMRNEDERQRNLAAALAKWLVELADVARARQIAGGNGHRHV
jgi:Lon protease-like protein